MWPASFKVLFLAFACGLAMVLAPGRSEALDGTSPAATKATAPKPLRTASKLPQAALKPVTKPDGKRETIAAAEAALESAPAQAPAEPKSQLARGIAPEVRQFCSNNAAAAGAARVAWQAAKLTELDTKLRDRIAQLEAKRSEYEAWLHKRDDAMKKAEDDVVAIYSKMRPDAAALQLAAMDDVVAAAVLAKLNSRSASAILAEMDPGRAAHLTNAMVSGVGTGDGKKS